MKNTFYAIAGSLFFAALTAVFIGCNVTAIPGSPTSASSPQNNQAIPQPPGTVLNSPLAFTGISTGSDNAFTFVALQALSAGTTIFFTTSGWDNNLYQLVGGKTVGFTPSITLPPGTQVIIEDGPVVAASAASIVYRSNITGVAGAFTSGGALSLSKDATDIIAYTVSSGGTTQFLAAINENTSTPFLTSGPATKGISYVPPGLQVGVSAVDLYKLQAETAVFANCGVVEFPLQITTTQMLAELVNPSNWVSAKKAVLPGTNVNMCDFTATINQVPTAITTPNYTPTVTSTPFPCGYPAATCTPTTTSTPLPYAPLAVGSIAFTGITSNGNEQISFVATSQVAPNTTIYFTNYTWDNTLNSNTGGFVDQSGTYISVPVTETLYSPTANNGLGGFAVTVLSSGVSNVITDGIIAYTTGSQGLAPYQQVVISHTSDAPDVLQGGSVAGVNGYDNRLELSGNGGGQAVIAFTTSLSSPSTVTVNSTNTNFLGGLIFGPDTWYQNVSNGNSIPAGNYWDSYLPPGLSSSSSTDLSGIWNTDDLNQYNNSADQNDNAVLQNCWSDLPDIVNPAHWIADGNAGKTHVNLSAPIPPMTGNCPGSAGYTGYLY